MSFAELFVGIDVNKNTVIPASIETQRLRPQHPDPYFPRQMEKLSTRRVDASLFDIFDIFASWATKCL